jgi:hypothetical protein
MAFDSKGNNTVWITFTVEMYKAFKADNIFNLFKQVCTFVITLEPV